VANRDSASDGATRLLGLAAVNVGLHLLGLLLAATALRPGTPPRPVVERLAYVGHAPAGWTAGWAVWMLCALALVLFVATLERRLDERGGLASALAVAGAAVDLLCETLWMVVLPAVASRGDEAVYLALERLAGAGGAVVANGFYSLAVLRLSASFARRAAGRPAGGAAALLGYAVAVAGLLLVAAGFGSDPRHLEWTAALTIGLFCLWAPAAARAAGALAEPG
jgi:hypothetical protein